MVIRSGVTRCRTLRPPPLCNSEIYGNGAAGIELTYFKPDFDYLCSPGSSRIARQNSRKPKVLNF